jgi:hypothetical protein
VFLELPAALSEQLCSDTVTFSKGLLAPDPTVGPWRQCVSTADHIGCPHHPGGGTPQMSWASLFLVVFRLWRGGDIIAAAYASIQQ